MLVALWITAHAATSQDALHRKGSTYAAATAAAVTGHTKAAARKGASRAAAARAAARGTALPLDALWRHPIFASGATSGDSFSPVRYRRFDPTLLADLVGKPAAQPNPHQKANCSHWIVLTTIQPPTPNLRALAGMPGWCKVFVMDRHSPPSFNSSLAGPGLVVLTVAEQERLGWAVASRVPWNHIGRKNLGYLYAVLHGAELIYDTDDDNYVLDDSPEFLPRSLAAPPPGWQLLSAPAVSAGGADVFNPYPFFGAPGAWPRGFPLSAVTNLTTQTGVTSRAAATASATAPAAAAPAAVAASAAAAAAAAKASSDAAPEAEAEATLEKQQQQQQQQQAEAAQLLLPPAVCVLQSPANADPDVDALYRLTAGGGLPLYFPPRRAWLALPAGTFGPFNAQATLFDARALAAGLALPVTVHGRVADIWRSYLLQAVAMWDVLRCGLAFAEPWVTQYRNAHTYLRDFSSELDLYLKTEGLLQLLQRLRLALPRPPSGDAGGSAGGDAAAAAHMWPRGNEPQQQQQQQEQHRRHQQLLLGGRVLAAYVVLYEHGLMEVGDVLMAAAWLSDLGALGPEQVATALAAAVSMGGSRGSGYGVEGGGGGAVAAATVLAAKPAAATWAVAKAAGLGREGERVGAQETWAVAAAAPAAPVALRAAVCVTGVFRAGPFTWPLYRRNVLSRLGMPYDVFVSTPRGAPGAPLGNGSSSPASSTSPASRHATNTTAAASSWHATKNATAAAAAYPGHAADFLYLLQPRRVVHPDYSRLEPLLAAPGWGGTGFKGPAHYPSKWLRQIADMAACLEALQAEPGVSYSHVVRLRADTAVVDPLPRPPAELGPDQIVVPDNESHGGVNDRIAYGALGPMRAYLSVLESVPLFLERPGRMESAEVVLLDHLLARGVSLVEAPLQVCRVRAYTGGRLVCGGYDVAHFSKCRKVCAAWRAVVA
ncbi:hypothetical protein HYH02_012500 [Chlamydomonas schloesseri]|uniref:Uncharacterized protein n=1 Tax=Chlamydomonas schloesseri TaxID=2026947 RepID=A0A835T9D2_9CHLO|nr:hypothetical protein HYH02_012500 [Chlamydomonas schloesseri]|eukprot:KAG2433955.1 hypothetical protein HYH02_012500 [Chlamydomonas schloesseri]